MSVFDSFAAQEILQGVAHFAASHLRFKDTWFPWPSPVSEFLQVIIVKNFVIPILDIDELYISHIIILLFFIIIITYFIYLFIFTEYGLLYQDWSQSKEYLELLLQKHITEAEF